MDDRRSKDRNTLIFMSDKGVVSVFSEEQRFGPIFISDSLDKSQRDDSLV